MFFRAKSPLTQDDQDWQLECWRWLLNHLGGVTSLKSTALVLPTDRFFPETDLAGHDRAQYLFGLVAGYLDVPADRFRLEAQEAPIDPNLGGLMVVQGGPVDPAGTFRADDDGEMAITYNPDSVGRPVELVATLAHELCHPILLSIADPPPGGPDCEEFATDLAMTYLGFGLFGANNAFKFQQFNDAAMGTQGWSTSRLGYLSPAEWGFSLAIFVGLAGHSGDLVSKYLSDTVLPYYKKAGKYLSANPEVMAGILATD